MTAARAAIRAVRREAGRGGKAGPEGEHGGKEWGSQGTHGGLPGLADGASPELSGSRRSGETAGPDAGDLGRLRQAVEGPELAQQLLREVGRP